MHVYHEEQPLLHSRAACPTYISDDEIDIVYSHVRHAMALLEGIVQSQDSGNSEESPTGFTW